MEGQVIRTHHEGMCHLGVEKCFELLSGSYWFPNMKTKVKDYIKTCLKCIYFSPESGKTRGILHSIPKGNMPFHTLHIDHLGPLSTGSKKHLFCVIDGFTKFVKLYPVKTTNTKEAATCLQSYFENYSRPIRIISDRGSCFTSKE
ncbi:protein NYNRIN-like [Episyrphus balteatus]|uniref:protein NYNRIN-like n=1 Tax=Episyrphus balteatus TaxID=286459 RepID=UPI0024850592|nr:protein NYNRIN-like [Episyrphus balteatus]